MLENMSCFREVELFLRYFGVILGVEELLTTKGTPIYFLNILLKVVDSLLMNFVGFESGHEDLWIHDWSILKFIKLQTWYSWLKRSLGGNKRLELMLLKIVAITPCVCNLFIQLIDKLGWLKWMYSSIEGNCYKY